MFVKTTDGIIVDIGVDVTPTRPIKEEMTNQELEIKLIDLERRIKVLEKGTELVNDIRPITCNDYGFIYDVCSRCGMPWGVGHTCKSRLY